MVTLAKGTAAVVCAGQGVRKEIFKTKLPFDSWVWSLLKAVPIAVINARLTSCAAGHRMAGLHWRRWPHNLRSIILSLFLSILSEILISHWASHKGHLLLFIIYLGWFMLYNPFPLPECPITNTHFPLGISQGSRGQTLPILDSACGLRMHKMVYMSSNTCVYHLVQYTVLQRWYTWADMYTTPPQVSMVSMARIKQLSNSVH